VSHSSRSVEPEEGSSHVTADFSGVGRVWTWGWHLKWGTDCHLTPFPSPRLRAAGGFSVTHLGGLGSNSHKAMGTLSASTLKFRSLQSLTFLPHGWVRMAWGGGLDVDISLPWGREALIKPPAGEALVNQVLPSAWLARAH
jgi:hypothetical protein